MYEFRDVDKVLLNEATFFFDGTFTVSRQYLTSTEIRGRWACIKDINDSYVENVISGRCIDRLIPKGKPNSYSYSDISAPVKDSDKKPIFVSPACKLPRDVLRRSYSITRDPDKKGCTTVIPHKTQAKTIEYNLAAYDVDRKIMYLYKFHKNFVSNENDVYSEENIKNIKDKAYRDMVNSYGYVGDVEYFVSDVAATNAMTFLFKCEEYKDIANITYPSRAYIFDDRVYYEPTPEINIDTLDMWKAMPEDMLFKSINSSDWQKYPFTLSLFLTNERRDVLYGSTDPAIATVFERIRVKVMHQRDSDAWIKDTTVSKDDWNLAQKWALHAIGIDEEGGSIVAARGRYVPYSPYTDLLRRKICVKPLYVDADVCGSSLVDILGNSN